MFDNINKDELIQSIINPLGGLNLTDSERKLLFFRHVGAEYAMAARRNRVPFASNITRAGTAFSGIGGGGTDPMMMLMLSSMTSDKPKVEKEDKSLADAATAIIESIEKVNARLDIIEANTTGL
jgi:hypothetical protein